jgi:ATP-binding cassette subfamily B protein
VPADVDHLRTRWRLARLAMRAGGATLWASVAVAAQSLVPAGEALVTGFVVASAVHVINGHAAGSRLVSALTLFVVLELVRQLTSSLTPALLARVSRAVDLGQRRRLRAWAAAESTTERLEAPSVQNDLRLSATVNDVSLGAAASSQLSLAGSWIAVLSLLALVARVSWWAAPLGLALNLGIARWIRRENTRLQAAWMSTVDVQRESEYTIGLVTSAARDLRVYGWQEYLLSRRQNCWAEGVAAQQPFWRTVGRRIMTAFALRWVAFVAVVASYCISAFRGHLASGDLVTFILALQTLLFRPAVDGSVQAAAGILEAHRRLHAAPSMAGENIPTPPAEACDELGPVLSLRDVSFSYPGRDHTAVDGLNLNIRRGESIALVGENGAGKTTLIKLLCGLYLPAAGVISVDGTDLTPVTLDPWRRRLAVVFQDYCRYPLSLRDNVVVGRRHDDEFVERAAHAAGVDGLLETLGHSWASELSKSFDDGTDLSGGQWQRVVVARALAAVFAGADVVVLDEPTAALDVRSELRVFDRILEATRDRTVILASHRLWSVRHADRILVLADGRIVEEGSHDQLLADKGRYHAMFTAQAAAFDDDVDDDLVGAAGA